MQLTLKVVLLPAGHVLLPGMVMRLRASPLTGVPEIPKDSREILEKQFHVGTKQILAILPRNQKGSPNTIGALAQVVESGQGVLSTKGLCRLVVDNLDPKSGTATVSIVEEEHQVRPEVLDELRAALTVLLQPMGATGNVIAQRFVAFTQGVVSSTMVVDLVATLLPLKNQDKLAILGEFNVSKRAQMLLDILKDQSRSLALVAAPQAAKRAAAMAGPRNNDDDDELTHVEETLAAAPLGDEGRRIVDREIRKIKRVNPQQAEYNVMRTYLETLADIPWSNNDVPHLDETMIQDAAQILDKDHYGLEKVKKRLIEYLSVLYLQQQRGTTQTKTPILCLAGPPGVGKTSLAQSVAEALKRPMHRISLGGVRDEAEIRGHRRTYIGAMPGILVQGLRKVRSMNPVFVLDEIDKVGQGLHSVHGDPSAALLEVLDPEQNSTFTDHYVGFPVDLSNVLFIATANNLENMPRPLLDRMEIIPIDGYTYLEKQHIAQSYLLPKQIRLNALDPSQISISNSVLDFIATRYTRESGVRNLSRQLGALCRGRAVEILNNPTDVRVKVEIGDLQRYLGLEPFHDDVVNDEVDVVERDGKSMLRETPGLVNGLAYMASGTGGLLVFEATLIPNGTGKLQLTGKLGDVISESAQIAMSWVRSHAVELGIAVDLRANDIHLHAPAGAIPKDGPSAGVAMTICLVSLLCHYQVPRNIAMTGEITLRGKILPVGGVREKLLGAHMAGVHHIILPYHCRPVVEDECHFVKDLDIHIDYVKYIWDVFALIWPSHSQFREPAVL